MALADSGWSATSVPSVKSMPCPTHGCGWMPNKRAQCEAVGVDEERALSAELVSYSDTDRWEYDKGFGIVRRPAAE